MSNAYPNIWLLKLGILKSEKKLVDLYQIENAGRANDGLAFRKSV